MKTLSRQGVREIVKAGLPGLMHFAGLSRLRVEIDAPIRELRLHIPETEFLNLEGLTVTTRGGVKLPGWKARASSAFSEAVRDAGRFLSGLAIHTKKEPLPWWRVQFAAPVAVQSIEIANRADRWAARGYGLCVDWQRADGVGEGFDNLGLPVLLARLEAFHGRVLRFAREVVGALWFADPAALRRYELLVQDCLALVGAMRAALTEQSVTPPALCEQRGRLLAQIADLLAGVDDAGLRALTPLAELAEPLIWKGYDDPVCATQAEAALMGFILASAFKRAGSVEFKRFLEFQRLMPARADVERLESDIERFIARLGGDTSVFPILVRPHGILGATIVRDEMLFVRSLREVIGVLGECGYQAALCQGTLLGAVREQRLLPHDDDVDTMFLAKAANENELAAELGELVETLARRNIRAARVDNLLFLKIFAPESGKPVDAFPAIPAGDGRLQLYMENLKWRDVPREAVEPFTTLEFYGEPAPVPARAEEFLAVRFGADWRTPNRFSRLAWLPR